MLLKADIIEFLTNLYFVQDPTCIPLYEQTLAKVTQATASLSKQDEKYKFILDLLRDIDTLSLANVPNMEYRFLEACRTLRE